MLSILVLSYVASLPLNAFLSIPVTIAIPITIPMGTPIPSDVIFPRFVPKVTPIDIPNTDIPNSVWLRFSRCHVIQLYHLLRRVGSWQHLTFYRY